MKKKDRARRWISEQLKAGQGAVTEDQAKKIFSSYGIPVVEELVAPGVDLAVEAAGKIGFPVVLKGMGKTILHKTEAGLVKPGLASLDQVREAAREMEKSGGGKLEGFVVQPMVPGRREFVAGMFRDPQFGPVILFGLGGVFTEALDDVVLKIAPLTDVDMAEMVDQLGSKKLLGSFRGEAGADMEGVRAVLGGLSSLAIENPGVKEIDINPLILRPDGRVVAVDGLMILEKQGEAVELKPRVDLSLLGSCFYPSSIAFVGASATPGKWGHMLPSNTLSRNYSGQVYLVNPRGGKIMGRQVYKGLSDIKGDVDLAVVTVPAARVMDLIPQMEKKNVKGMLLITSGFREVGPEGAELESRLVKAADKAGILLLGPNTMGACNPHARFFCSAAHAYPLPGSTALVSQSGNMGTQLLAFAEQQGIGIRAFSGSGNEAMVTIEDYMEAFEKDELTRTVVLYIESIKDGKRFFESATRVSGKKPVVVLKGGRTSQGEKAASSHTGAMASDARVFCAACRQAGIIQVDQPMELLDLSAAFSSLPLPRGSRVAIMTLGGGWGVVATDLCAEHGLTVPRLSGEIIERLNKILPPFWSHGNPVDIVGEGDPSIPMACMEELARWDGCDAVIHLGIHGKRVLVNSMMESIIKTDPDVKKEEALLYKDALLKFEEDYIKYMVELTHTHGKPILGVSLLTDELSRTLYRFEEMEHKGVFFPSPERAVKALAGMVQYRNWLASHGKESQT